MSPMTLAQALAQIDTLLPNTFSAAEKTRWLSEAEGHVADEILRTHEGAGQIAFSGYDETTDTAVPLLVPPPYDSLYRFYVEAQIHFANGEATRCNNARSEWNNAFSVYQAYYTRTHRPLTPCGALRVC